jgi:hypothetical protein
VIPGRCRQHPGLLRFAVRIGEPLHERASIERAVTGAGEFEPHRHADLRMPDAVGEPHASRRGEHLTDRARLRVARHECQVRGVAHAQQPDIARGRREIAEPELAPVGRRREMAGAAAGSRRDEDRRHRERIDAQDRAERPGTREDARAVLRGDEVAHVGHAGDRGGVELVEERRRGRVGGPHAELLGRRARDEPLGVVRERHRLDESGRDAAGRASDHDPVDHVVDAHIAVPARAEQAPSGEYASD